MSNRLQVPYTTGGYSGTVLLPGEVLVDTSTGRVVAGDGTTTGGVPVAKASEVAGKADASTVNAALAAKADASTVTTALAAKADAATVTTSLAAKADATALTTGLALKANATMANVAEFEDATLTLSGTYAARINTPGSQNEYIEAALGTHYIARHHFAARISGTTTANNGSAGAGGVIAVDGASARIGGTNMTSVAEVRSDLGVVDVRTTNHPNPNAVTNAARMVVLSDCQSLNGNLLNCFASNLVVSNGRQIQPGGSTPKAAKNYNVCGQEIDIFLSTFGESPAPLIGGTSGISLVRAGDARPPKASNNDAAIVVAASAAMQGNGQAAYSGGWYAGINFTSALAPAGIGNPLTTDGSLITVTGAQTVKYGFNLQSLTATTSYFLTPDTNIGSGALILSAANHGIEIGSQSAANTPYIDFHASGAAGDGDARISANGGSGVIGSGAIVVQASSFATTGLVRPSTDNAQTLGNASFRWATAYFATSPVVGSDARIKEQVEDLGADWLAFLRALRPVSYRLKNITTPAVTETRTVRRQKQQTVTVQNYVVREVDGERVSQLCEEEVQIGVTEEVPSLDIDGNPEMIRRVVRTEAYSVKVARQQPLLVDGVAVVDGSGAPVLEDVLDGTGAPIFDDVEKIRRVEEEVAKTVEVPVWEDVEEVIEITPSNSQAFARLHVGFIAQEVRDALSASGLESSGNAQESVWSIFAYDAEADLYMLRMEYFIAPLLMGWQDHDRRLAAVDG